MQQGRYCCITGLWCGCNGTWKGAYAIHQSGKWYTNDNIDRMLMERHLNKKARRESGKNHIKGPKKRTSEDDEHFSESFEKLIFMAIKNNGSEA